MYAVSFIYIAKDSKEQEKKQSSAEVYTAEQVRQEKFETMKRMTEQMQNERAFMPETAGEMAIHDRMSVHQYYALCQSEEELHVQDENVQVCQEALFLHDNSRKTEKLIESMEAEIAAERKRKQDNETNELGVMAWWRNQGLLDWDIPEWDIIKQQLCFVLPYEAFGVIFFKKLGEKKMKQILFMLFALGLVGKAFLHRQLLKM